MMANNAVDATGFIDAPMELVRELVERYVAGGNDKQPMREIVSFVLSGLGERLLSARLTQAGHVTLGGITLTLDQAEARIEELRSLPLF